MRRIVRLAGIAAAGFLPWGGLYLGAALGAPQPWAVAAVSLATLVLAVGWPSLTGVPSRFSARLVLILTGALAIGLAALWQGAGSPVLVALGLGFPAVFARELARRAPRPDLVRSVAATACGVMAVAVCGLWVTAAQAAQFQDLAFAAACGIAAACLALGLSEVLAAPWRGEAGAAGGVVLAAAAGAAVSFGVGTPWWAAAAVAAACGVAPGALWLVGEAHRVFDGPPRWRDAALTMLPLAVAAAPVWAAQLMR
jgi:hypothetical protein